MSQIVLPMAALAEQQKKIAFSALGQIAGYFSTLDRGLQASRRVV